MRFVATLLPFFLVIAAVSAQSTSKIKDILAQEPYEVDAYDTSGFGEYQLAIRFNYASAKVLNPADYAGIRAYGKLKVEYIYSKYTQSQPSQKELDFKRYQALQKLAPDLFENPAVNWDIIVQSGATTADSARGLFHGFVITYQPPVSAAKTARVRRELDGILECAKRNLPEGAPEFPGGNDSLYYWLETNIKFPKEITTKGERRMVMIEWEIDEATGKTEAVGVSRGAGPKHNEHVRAVVQKMPEWSEGLEGVRYIIGVEFELTEDGKQRIDAGKLTGYDPTKCKNRRSDSTVLKIFERNPQWKNMLVVEDVTGSMLPYVGDLLLWNALKDNVRNVKHFIFFNDGDALADGEKKIGSTGGLYHVRPKRIEDLEETMIQAMSGGDGGDGPENDLEAVLAGIKACPDCKEIILIADNSVTPRDLELLSKIDRPVHVVLCGARDGVPNPAHLLIAWKTKGSLHTIKQDINNLTNLQEGQGVTIMGQNFKILNGKFVPVTKL